MRTENVVPCHPGHNAVSSISGCPSCDHAVLSFQSHVALSTLLCYSPPTGKATPMHLVASDTFPSSATKQRNENKLECSLRSRREITDVLVPDCNMAAWSLLARRGRKIKKRFLFSPCFWRNKSLGCWIVSLQRHCSLENTGEKYPPLSKH